MIKRFTKILVYSSAILILSLLVFVVMYILVNGLVNLKVSLFSLEYTSENSSMLHSIITTILVIFFSLLITVLIGVSSAIYLCIYTKSNSKMVFFVTITAETLSGIPSIIYGLFGYILFVIKLKFNYSLISCILTSCIMILPVIIKTTEESIKAMDKKYEFGSYALGAGKFYTIKRIVLPNILDGILAGIILSTGRIVGETAAFLYTLGTVAKIPNGFFSSSRTLAIHMWSLSQEGQKINETFAMAVVLLVVVLVVNLISTKFTERIVKK